MKTSSWIAIGLFAATAAWLASGYIIDGDEDEEDRAATAQPTLVEVRSSEARTVRNTSLRKAAPSRSARPTS